MAMKLDRIGRREYGRQRKLGAPAHWAIQHARTLQRWERLEAAGLVRLTIKPDESPDLSWLNQTDDEMGPGFERNAKIQHERANSDGCWGIVGQWRVSEDDDWETADSVWGFIGDDWKDSGYDSDVMGATIDALRQALSDRCPRCKQVA